MDRKRLIEHIVETDVVKKTMTKHNYYMETQTDVITGKIVTKNLKVYSYNLLIPASVDTILVDMCDKTGSSNHEKELSKKLRETYNVIVKSKDDDYGITYTMFVSGKDIMEINDIFLDVLTLLGNDAEKTMEH